MDKRTIILVAAVILALVAFNPTLASADSTTYTLTTGNPGGLGCCTGPYATVTVTLTSSTTATVTFDSLTNGGYTYLMAGAQAADVNVNAGTFTFSGLSGTNSLSGFTPGPLSSGGSGNVNGFGNFNQTFDSFDGFTHSSTEITFTLTDTSGTWSSASNVLDANTNGSVAAIHGFACADTPTTCNSTTGAFATGYASNGAEAVPEPGMLAMLFAGLVPVGRFVYKFRRA
jgi:hypothetical protein